MSEKNKENMEWVEHELSKDLEKSKTDPEYQKNCPYKVVLVDQYEGHCEDGYADLCRYRTLEEAIASARRITEEALLRVGAVDAWHGMGDGGLVYDANNALVWDGIREYTSCKGSDEVFAAMIFSAKAHSGQYRKGSTVPYFVHPLGVAKNLIESGCTNKIVIAGLLHDVLEDTKVPYEEIRDTFGRYIAQLVINVTEPNREDTWRNRKTLKIEHLKSVGGDVLLVACADKLDNIRALRYDFSKVGNDLWSRFNCSREDMSWYYTTLVEVFNGHKPGPSLKRLIKDLSLEVSAVFGAVSE